MQFIRHSHSSSRQARAIRFIALCLFYICISAQQVWSQSLHLAHETIPNAELAALSSDGKVSFRYTANGTEKLVDSLDWSEFVSWGYIAVVRSPQLVILDDGSHIAAQRLVVNEKTLRIESEVFLDVVIPWQSVKSIVFQLPRRLNARDRLLSMLREHMSPESSDLVVMADGSTVPGNIIHTDDQAVHLRLGNTPIIIPRERITAIAFSASKPSRLLSSHTVGISDGSLLVCEQLNNDGESLKIQTSNGLTLSTIPPVLPGDESGYERICFIQSGDSDVVWLDTLEPSHFRHIPLLGVNWGFNLNQSVEGGGLRTRTGESTLRGIGMHPTSVIQFAIPENANEFVSEVAIDYLAGRRGSVSVHVLLSTDGKQWDEVYTSGVLRGRDSPIAMRMSVNGNKHLSLVVNHADDGDVLDHINWLRPHITLDVEN